MRVAFRLLTNGRTYEVSGQTAKALMLRWVGAQTVLVVASEGRFWPWGPLGKGA